MGHLNNGPNGGFSGKAGSYIGYTWKGGSYIRGLPKIKKRRKLTPGQLAARAKFAYLNDWLKKMKPLMAITFRSYAAKMTGMMAAYSCNHGAVLGEYPDFSINFPEFMVSHGDLPGADDAKVVYEEPRILNYTWKWESIDKKANSGDSCLVLAIIPDSGNIYSNLEYSRHPGSALLDISKEDSGKVAEVYLAFISFDRLRVSKSQYLGQVTVL
jgi:uncharacterized protein DUF6266